MTPKADDPIQEQLIQARRTQILDAATKVFADKGFHRATIRDVASAAGIADGTIYNYFENKTALLMGILNRLNETEQRAVDLENVVQGDVRSLARAYIRHRYEVITRDGFEVFQVLISEIMINSDLRELYYQQVIEPTFAIADQFFQQWADEGVIKPLDVRLSTRAISAMFLGMLLLRVMGDKEVEARWDEVPDIMADILLQGIVPLQGIEQTKGNPS